MSPDFLARNVSLTDFTPEGTPKLLAYADDVQHFSDERMRAERIQVISLDPNSAPAFAQADEGWSNDGLENHRSHRSCARAPQTISRPAADDLYNRTPDGMA